MGIRDAEKPEVVKEKENETGLNHVILHVPGLSDMVRWLVLLVFMLLVSFLTVFKLSFKQCKPNSFEQMMFEEIEHSFFNACLQIENWTTF